MGMYVDSDEGVDEPSRAFQRSVRGGVSAVRLLCVVLCVVWGGCVLCVCVVCCGGKEG